MNPRGIVSEEDLVLLRATRAAKDTADAEWRDAVLGVAARSSIRSAAKAAGVSVDTISRWKRDQ